MHAFEVLRFVPMPIISRRREVDGYPGASSDFNHLSEHHIIDYVSYSLTKTGIRSTAHYILCDPLSRSSARAESVETRKRLRKIDVTKNIDVRGLMRSPGQRNVDATRPPGVVERG